MSVDTQICATLADNILLGQSGGNDDFLLNAA